MTIYGNVLTLYGNVPAFITFFTDVSLLFGFGRLATMHCIRPIMAYLCILDSTAVFVVHMQACTYITELLYQSLRAIMDYTGRGVASCWLRSVASTTACSATVG